MYKYYTKLKLASFTLFPLVPYPESLWTNFVYTNQRLCTLHSRNLKMKFPMRLINDYIIPLFTYIIRVYNFAQKTNVHEEGDKT